MSNDLVHCAKSGCEATIKNHAWGHIKASPDWFEEKSGKSWCPEHHPEWVAKWRGKKKKVVITKKYRGLCYCDGVAHTWNSNYCPPEGPIRKKDDE